MLIDLLEAGDLTRCYQAEDYHTQLHAELAAIEDESGLRKALRKLRKREFVRIAWRDLAGWAELEETVRDTSAFADQVIAATLERLHAWQGREFGEPRGPQAQPQQLLVFAMGKLGAEELNFSSDIDLIFAYPEQGHTTGGRRPLANEQFFLRLGRRLISVLSEATEDGIVFRVDMRLRPFGASGPLVMSFAAMEEYYQSHGRDWERYALIRARPVAGDIEGGRRLLVGLRPFIYRRYLDYGAIESLREMKQLITQQVNRKGLQDNLKLGPGGIREIEFLGQVFQLIRGGREPELRGRRIAKVLARLGESGYLPASAVTQLSEAYRFLRQAEHRLQQLDDRQTHTLPEDALVRACVAAGMGCESWKQFEEQVAQHRTNVHQHFSQIFPAPTESVRVSDQLHPVFLGTLGEQQAIDALASAGFADAVAAYEQVVQLRHSAAVRTLGARGRKRLETLLPRLLAAVGKTERAEETLQRAFRLVEAIASRSAYLALLLEHPEGLSHLVRLCAASPWIARLIGSHPLLLDELLDPRTLYSPPAESELGADLRARLARIKAGDTEEEMDCLRQFKQASVLRVAAADVAEAVPLMVVSDHLTHIAEASLRVILDLALRDLTERHGSPRCLLDGKLVEAGFAIVAYGKLGGIELGYGSDLDLVFLHSSGGDQQQTSGSRAVDNSLFFGRLGRRIIHFLSAHTSSGMLYQVDSRLRPSGSAGLLVSSIEAFAEYQHNSAWTWEHQALVRARPVAGDPALQLRFRELRERVLRKERDPALLRQDVREMRARMRAELGNHDPALFDLKQDWGGIADIEFMVQYGTLRWSSRLGEFLRFTDNIRLLEGFAAADVMSRADVDLLADAYRTYRARVHVLALQERPAIVDAGQFADQRKGVQRLWQHLLED
jgi:glutamate-ammonia-ligase adenylyltransferase